MRKHLSSGVPFMAKSRAAVAAFSVVAGAATTLALTTMFAPGCSTKAAASTACDPSLCAEGNSCISDGTKTECRRACDAQTGATGCAFNWTCTQGEGAEKPYCVADKLPYTSAPTGQWGSPCKPSGGFGANPDCDSAQTFWCYGASPTDGQAFCTQYQCQLDKDCRGGWYCATINQKPYVEDVNRSVKLTTTVCLPRDYCAPCENNVDCAPLSDGTPRSCVADATGAAKFCTSGCANDANCRLDAKCVANEATGGSVCVPRAGVCKGDGSLCAPCRSDDECPQGVCNKAPFSDERFCGVQSKVPCEVSDAGALVADCPKPPDGAPYRVSCITSATEAEFPKDQCIGVVQFGDNGNVGCWTVAR